MRKNRDLLLEKYREKNKDTIKKYPEENKYILEIIRHFI